MRFVELQEKLRDQLEELDMDESVKLLLYTAKIANHGHLNFRQTETLLDIFSEIWERRKAIPKDSLSKS